MGGQAAEFSRLAQKATTTAIEGKTLLQAFWNYELFVAEDTIEVDGKKVTGYSSITIGKVSRALIIFTAGVLLTLWLARIGETIVVRRFGYDAGGRASAQMAVHARPAGAAGAGSDLGQYPADDLRLPRRCRRDRPRLRHAERAEESDQRPDAAVRASVLPGDLVESVR